jgi:hypothetical protein
MLPLIVEYVKHNSYEKTNYPCLRFVASINRLVCPKNTRQYNSRTTLQKANKQFFIENKGQWHPDVLYLTRMGGLDVWITKYGVNYTFYKIEKNPHAKKADILLSKFDHDMEDATLLGHRVLMKLQNHRAILCPRASKSNRAITITSLATTRANTPRTWAYTKKPW